jgi:hypothetical protein
VGTDTRYLMLAQPRNDLGGVLVRRKHRIERFADDALSTQAPCA